MSTGFSVWAGTNSWLTPDLVRGPASGPGSFTGVRNANSQRPDIAQVVWDQHEPLKIFPTTLRPPRVHSTVQK